MAYKFHGMIPARKCEGMAQSGLIALRDALEQLYPSQASWGIYNCRNARGSSTLSHHAEGRAYDIKVLRNKVLGDAIAKALLENAYELGLDHVIWYRRKWNAKYPNGTAYRGSNPTLRHEDHIHVGMAWGAATSMTKEQILQILGDGEFMLSRGSDGNAVRKLQKALMNWNSRALPQFGADADYGAETEEWVKAYQKAANLPQTGNADGVTVAFILEYV